ncbi:hypothetical protein ABC955_13340 [Citromicrobium bathyomarinum]
MPASRTTTIREIYRNRVVRFGSYGVAALGAYDVCSNQFGFPKLPKVLGMTGALMPWWGWLLLLQALFVYGLFEFVRRSQPLVLQPLDGGKASKDDNANLSGLAAPALRIVRRIRRHRNAGYFARDRSEPVEDIWRSAVPVIIAFEKAGFPVPELTGETVLHQLITLDEYFSTLIPLISAGQFDEAREIAPQVVKMADEEGTTFNGQQWFGN